MFGMTRYCFLGRSCGSPLRVALLNVIPAQAGMTVLNILQQVDR